MASRFEESARLMRRMAEEGFVMQKNGSEQRITHPDPATFQAWGFISEESPVRQLNLIPDDHDNKRFRAPILKNHLWVKPRPHQN